MMLNPQRPVCTITLRQISTQVLYFTKETISLLLWRQKKISLHKKEALLFPAEMEMQFLYLAPSPQYGHVNIY